ncbi:hypothetical protein KYC5002_10370 [Archangium violaceum]|uniref:WD40/YVTN/BNR-like repeat-containing protein n=1 Tax=Archangium violaceum TaxID=83451 RepID=UPI002B2939A7|nr:hypothetical protein KYC5002_10370 [Archangium gephyra]
MSEDGGKTLQTVTFTDRPGTNTPPGTVFDVRRGLWVGLTLEGRLWVSRDGGNSFTATHSWLGKEGTSQGKQVVFRNGKRGYFSSDDGFTFEGRDLPTAEQSIAFTPGGTLVTGMFDADASGYRLAVSKDLGVSWQPISRAGVRRFGTGPGPDELWVEFFPLLRDPIPQVIHTTDLGQKWERLSFSSAGTPIEWDGNGTTFSLLSDGRIHVELHVEDTPLLRPAPYCITAPEGTGTLIPRPAPQRSDTPGSLEIWAQLPSGSVDAVPLPTLGRAVARKDSSVLVEAGGERRVMYNLPQGYRMVADVAALPGGQVAVVLESQGYAYEYGPAFSVFPLEPTAFTLNTDQPQLMSVLGSATNSRLRYHWRVEKLYSKANGELFARASAVRPEGSSVEIFPLKGEAVRDRFNRYARLFPDGDWFTVALKATATNNALPLMPKHSYAPGAGQDYCAVGMCFGLPEGLVASEVWVTGSGMVYAYVESSRDLYARRFSDGAGPMTRVATGFIHVTDLVSFPDQATDELYIVDGDLFRLIPDFNHVAVRPE